MRMKKQRAARRKGFFGRLFGRIFCPRNIIIISAHKTDHVPVSIRRQLVWVFGVLAFVSWASYSTGNYMAAQETLREKEQVIANSNLKNRRIESEFALLKRDLVSLLDKENPEELGDYAKFVIEQYRANGRSLEDIDVDLSQLSSSKHGAVFERIAFLEETVDALKQDHRTIIDAIRETAQGRLDELETIVRTTGLRLDEVEEHAQDELEDRLAVSEKDRNDTNPQGGPFDPMAEAVLKQYNETLYRDLTRVVLLDELVRHLPTESPMKDYRLTSGYGMRMDPFRKRLAHHAGLDFAGPPGAKVYAVNDGVITHAGRKGAYGKLVEIDHGLSLATRYGHLHQVLVEEGQRVRKGQVIGLQGSTGRSTGAHLHYEVRYRGATLNPKNFLKAGNYVRKIEQTNE